MRELTVLLLRTSRRSWPTFRDMHSRMVSSSSSSRAGWVTPLGSRRRRRSRRLLPRSAALFPLGLQGSRSTARDSWKQSEGLENKENEADRHRKEEEKKGRKKKRNRKCDEAAAA